MLSFKTLYVITQIFGLSVVIATVLWVLKYMGLVWDVTNIDIYNWHAICMVLGMVFCYGNCELSSLKFHLNEIIWFSTPTRSDSTVPSL